MTLSRPDPSRDVERAFTRIERERMAGLPILNPALCVQAVGFERWREDWLGIVITPWCMSVLLLPCGGEARDAPAASARKFMKFPFGEIALLDSREPELGTYRTFAVFSPMDSFASQAQALATARASLAALLAPPAAERAASAREHTPARRRFLGLASKSGALI